MLSAESIVFRFICSAAYNKTKQKPLPKRNVESVKDSYKGDTDGKWKIFNISKTL